MAFAYDEKIDDLFIKSETSKDVFKVNRSEVRLLAEKCHAYLKAAELSGGNKHAAELDVNDATVDLLTKIMTSEYASMADDLNAVLLEEKQALLRHDFDLLDKKKLEEMNEPSAKSDIQRALPWLIAVVALLIFAGLFKS
ncbi:hypothetical protein [Erwinia sp. Leaf53]|uniref:hypothetical protein n=1 Tax=Erwinia sp. Leaf53 TaxID=1736225 RepID=UPI0006F4B2F7|nr:hypothetical protein [Erwinia sp. Leaf53]KQN53213.1 hypothetical protein ASF13_16585 [Erwinia sp. Leaf53]